MSTVPQSKPKIVFLDKARVRRIVAEQNEKMGFVKDPGATALGAQAKMIALGIRPEENLFSRGIMAMREE